MKIQPSVREPVSDDWLSKSAFPKVSYKKALGLYLRTRSGKVVTIRDCSAKDMAHLVEKALATLDGEQLRLARRDLAGLDYSQPLDRWYCLDTLRECGACAPVFETASEAAASRTCGQVAQGVTQA